MKGLGDQLKWRYKDKVKYKNTFWGKHGIMIKFLLGFHCLGYLGYCYMNSNDDRFKIFGSKEYRKDKPEQYGFKEDEE